MSSKFLNTIKSRLSGRRVPEHRNRTIEVSHETRPDEFRRALDIMDTRVSVGVTQAVNVGSKAELEAIELKATRDIAHLVYGDVADELRNLRITIRDLSMERGYQLDGVLDGVDNIHALLRP